MMKEAFHWVKENEQLSNLVNDLKSSGKTDEEIALAIFHQVAELYQLPKTFQDTIEEEEEIDDEDEEPYEQPHCVFEELAIISYLGPRINIINRVILALYLVHNKEHMEIEKAAIQYFGSEDQIIHPCFVYFFGKDIDARISFGLPDGFTNWVDAGAVAVWQLNV